MTCPPNIAAWIARDPERRIWRRDHLLIWNFHPRLGVQVDGGPLAPLLPGVIHQCMCDSLFAEARRQLSHLESQARDYQRMANEMREIRDTIKR